MFLPRAPSRGHVDVRVVGGCLRWRPGGGGGCGGLLGPRQRRAGVEAVVAAILVSGDDGCPEGWGVFGTVK